MLPVAASEHGVETDWLLNFNWVDPVDRIRHHQRVAVLVRRQVHLQQGSPSLSGSRTTTSWSWLWTIVPAAVLAVIIIYGLQHAGPTSPRLASRMRLLVELYARQFDWTARYPGADGGLGATDFRLINGTNPLGIVTQESVATRLAEMDQEIDGPTASWRTPS